MIAHSAELDERDPGIPIQYKIGNWNGMHMVALTTNFYHTSPWDIKREISWEDTIGTFYPGFKEIVIYNDYKMRPENLGNYTYGYLGHAYGFSMLTLLAGSYYAADFPTSGSALQNEFLDWKYIIMGYKSYCG